jgi:leader peptidase (prepilin peptidase)/N-methyltransferase
MPRELSLIKPGSHCPGCKHKIAIWHNIPVFGWLILRGRCANCKEPIPVSYPIVEILTATLGFLAAFLAEPNPWQSADLVKSISLFWFLTTLVPIFAIDFKHLLLPDTVTIGGILLGFALSFFPGSIGWLSSLIGIAACGGSLFLFGFVCSKILKKEGMGFGDVKLLAGFGAIMGAELAGIALIIGASLALIITIPHRLLTKKNMQLPLPFGPFLGVAAPISYLFGDAMLQSFLSLLFQFNLSGL